MEEVDSGTRVAVTLRVHAKLAGVLLITISLAANAAEFKVTSTRDDGPDTLRAALVLANATPGFDVILLATTALPTSALPTITDPVEIRGTDGDSSGINGANAGASTDGFVVAAAGSKISSLRIEQFGGDGIVVNADLVELTSLYVIRNRNGARIAGDRDGIFGCDFMNNHENGILATAASSRLHIGGHGFALGGLPRVSVSSFNNGAAGLRLDGNEAIVESTAVHNNAGDGCFVSGMRNDIRDVFAYFNTGYGFVYLTGTLPKENRATGACNLKLLFDVNGDGPTANDEPDVDGVTNAPVLTSAVDAGDVVTISGTLTARPATTFRVSFFATTVCTSRWVGDQLVVTDDSGHASFRKALPRFIGYYAAQAARYGDRGDASELSNLINPTVEAVPAADLGLEMTASPPAVAGGTVTVEYRVTNYGPSAIGPYQLFTANAANETPICGNSGCTMPPLASGDSFTMTRTIDVTAAAGSTFFEKAAIVVSASHPDPRLTNNSASISLPVIDAAAVPALSHWALFALALSLFAVVRLRS